MGFGVWAGDGLPSERRISSHDCRQEFFESVADRIVLRHQTVHPPKGQTILIIRVICEICGLKFILCRYPQFLDEVRRNLFQKTGRTLEAVFRGAIE